MDTQHSALRDLELKLILISLALLVAAVGGTLWAAIRIYHRSIGR